MTEETNHSRAIDPDGLLAVSDSLLEIQHRALLLDIVLANVEAGSLAKPLLSAIQQQASDVRRGLQKAIADLELARGAPDAPR